MSVLCFCLEFNFGFAVILLLLSVYFLFEVEIVYKSSLNKIEAQVEHLARTLHILAIKAAIPLGVSLDIFVASSPAEEINREIHLLDSEKVLKAIIEHYSQQKMGKYYD